MTNENNLNFFNEIDKYLASIGLIASIIFIIFLYVTGYEVIYIAVGLLILVS